MSGIMNGHTVRAIARVIRRKRPTVISERGEPRYVVLDWNTYRAWEVIREDTEDHIRFEIAERESRGRKRHTLAAIKRKYRLS